ncbi:MAG: sugar phosphate isomerase/epimerase [Bryobacteraceae bacterium]|nr:sugar phosphate isomerase/epimerase [Bryobacteraceae bacterium]
MTRRNFLTRGALGAGIACSSALTTSAGPWKKPAPLGLNTYCLRALKWNDRQLIEYAASLKLDAIFLQDSLDPATASAAHWAEVRSISKDLGLHLETGGGGIFVKGPENHQAAVENLRYQITRAQAMGSPLIRVVIASSRAQLPPQPPERTLEKVADVFRSVREQVKDAGMKIALEVHKDFQAWEFKNLVEAAGPEYVGIYMDTGNPVYVLEHPLTTLETLAPYIVTLHLRDSVVYEHKRGVAVQWVPLGEGIVDFKEILAKAEALVGDVYVYVKPITGRPPDVLPYLEQDFWKLYPRARSSEFARFLSLAKKGSPYEGHVVIEDLQGRATPAHFAEAIRYQQREHMERSVEYAKRTLDLGQRWRT